MAMTPVRLACAFFSTGLYFSATAASVITQNMVEQGLCITQAGEWYLEESITIYAQTGITVLASSVVIDLKGHTMRAAEDAAVGISIEAHDCVVKNGAIEGFSSVGILIDTGDGVVLSHISLHGNQVGVGIIDSSSVELKHMVLQEVGYRGIEIENSESVHLVACTIKDSQYQGIVVHENCCGVMIDASHVHSCQDVGLLLEADGVYCTYVSVQRCNNDGVVIKGKNCECSTVLSLHNQGSGFVIEGINQVMRNCKAGYNGCDGIRLEETAMEASILGGAYALNNSIGINNKANLGHTISSVQVYENKKRNMYRVMPMH